MEKKEDREAGDFPYAKYGECVRILNHYTDRNRSLRVKTLCDLFNDMAELHTFQQEADVASLNKVGLTWMLHRIHLFLPDVPRWEEKVVVETWNPSFDGLLVPRVYKVSDCGPEQEKLYSESRNVRIPVRGKLRAFAHTDWMLINLSGRRPERPTALMRDRVGHYGEELPFTPSLLDRNERKAGLAPVGEILSSSVFPARYSDIDFNGHVTQSSHIQWMMDTHGFDFQEKARLVELEVLYAHEIRPGSRVRVEVFDPEGECGEEAAVLRSMSRKKATLSYRVSDLDGNLPYAWGKGVWALRA